jgi:chromosome segregation ATPase
MKNLKDQLTSMQEEMKSEFKKTLTNDELDRLEALTKSIAKYQKEYSDTSIERLNLETQRQNVEQEIRTTLYPRRDLLKSRSVDEEDDQLDERRTELEALNKALKDILAKQKTSESAVEKLGKSMRENRDKLIEFQVRSGNCFVNDRLHMQRLHVRLREIKRQWSRVWLNARICFISAMSVIKAFEISVYCLKKLMKNTKMQIPQKYDLHIPLLICSC